MSLWIAWFRGINVGGKNILPMKELVQTLESLGCRDVKTYIQSGNAVFRSLTTDACELQREIVRHIEQRHGFGTEVMLLTPEQLDAVIDVNPYPEATEDPSKLHVYFLAEHPSAAKWEALAAAQSPTERYHLVDRAMYFHAPDGMGRSKLAGVMERSLGVSATARNWRTLEKIQAMVRELSPS